MTKIAAMFPPPWIRAAKMLLKGTRKFLAYQRDLLEPERLAELENGRAALRSALHMKDQARTRDLTAALKTAVDAAQAAFPRPRGWHGLVETLWVTLVILCGIRSYGIWAFRIPTGSMQPTLNGINLRPLEAAQMPGTLQTLWDRVVRGRRYVTVTSPGSGTVVGIEESSLPGLTWTAVQLTDGSTFSLPAGQGVVRPLLIDAYGRSKSFAKGEVVFRGAVESGDLVVVDRFSYHFRRPARGEVFVFDTRGLNTKGAGARDKETTYYIKRLTGVPGDRLQINPPDLMINGAIPAEPGIRQIMDCRGPYGQVDPLYHPAAGYTLAPQIYSHAYPFAMTGPNQVMELAKDAPPGLREYMAMGDNTGNSADSRFWGSVKEYNLLGPAFFSLWPLASGHWGFIR